MAKMTIGLLAVAIACLLALGMPHAGSAGAALNSSAVYGRIVNNTGYNSVNASPSMIGDAESYLYQRLGRNYTISHMTKGFRSVYDNYTSDYYNDTGLSYVYFSYNVTFANGTSAVKSSYVYAPLFTAIVLNGNGNVIWYDGPSKPYTAIIPPNRAASIALEHDFSNARINYGYSLIPGIYNMSDNTSGYDIAWIVTGNYTSRGTFPVLYIDPETGNVLGEGYGFSSPGGTLPSPQFPYPAILGNFSVFRLGNATTTIAGANRGGGANILYALAVLIALAVAIAIFFLVKSSRKH